jgi:translation initiation factor IF-2
MEIKIIHSDVGNITDSDLIFAQASQAIVIGYNVTTTATLQKKAELMKVVVKQYDIIYEFIDRLEKLALGLVEIEKSSWRHWMHPVQSDSKLSRQTTKMRSRTWKTCMWVPYFQNSNSAK